MLNGEQVKTNAIVADWSAILYLQILLEIILFLEYHLNKGGHHNGTNGTLFLDINNKQSEQSRFACCLFERPKGVETWYISNKKGEIEYEIVY